MKKFLVILMALIVVCSVFAACSKNTENDDTTTNANPNEIVTEDAKIKEGEAIEFIRNAYTAKELGLDDTDKNYQFMVASAGVDIDGKNYVKVVANVPIKNDTTNEDGQVTYSMETLGEYFISFDGKTVLIKDMKTGEYSELENKYDQYKEKGATEAESDK